MSQIDKQTLTIISCQLINKLTDKDTLPRGDTEKVFVDPRDLAIIRQMLPEDELSKRILDRGVTTIPGRFTVKYNCTIVEVKQLLKELDSVR